MEDKREQRGAEALHSSEPQKAHPIGEFFVVAYYGAWTFDLSFSL